MTTDREEQQPIWYASRAKKFVTKRVGLAAAVALGAMLSIAPLAQAEPADPSTPQTEVIVPAPAEAAPTAVPKLKIKGVVTRRDADTFTVRDMNGVDTVVPPK
jgi:hypothetical protein